jgi:hypothetical protein
MRSLAATLALVLASFAAGTPATTDTAQGRGAQSATPPPARRDATVPFAVGETLTFDVAYMRMLVAGTATARVVERKAANNSTAYALVAEGRPISLVARLYPVYYKMDALADTVTLLSQWTALYAEETGKHRQTTTFFDRQNKRAFYEVPSDPALKDTFSVPADVQDGLTLLYVLRTRQFAAGDRLVIPVADDGSLYTAEFVTQGRERTSVPFGDLDAWNIRIRIVDSQQQEVGKNLGVWISTDSRRLPLRIEAALPVGTFSLALREVR